MEDNVDEMAAKYGMDEMLVRRWLSHTYESHWDAAKIASCCEVTPEFATQIMEVVRAEQKAGK